MAPVARLTGVSKRFGTVQALDGVDLDLLPGEVHGLLGENGAGKSTLALILAGLLRADEGVIQLGEGVAAKPRMVHQHFSLVPRFTGLENIALFNRGAETALGKGVTGYKKLAQKRARELGLEVNLTVPVERLGVGERQRIEILKALLSDTRVLILDEPTAVLTPAETESLFAVLTKVAHAGTGILLIAHKLDEVLKAADRVTVLRRGQKVLAGANAKMTARELAAAMIGGREGAVGERRAVRDSTEAGGQTTGVSPLLRTHKDVKRSSQTGQLGQVVASLSGVSVVKKGHSLLRDVTLTVRRGEIVGVAGVAGNGQHELAALLASVTRPTAGSIQLPDEVGWLPADRVGEGLAGEFTATENVALALHRNPNYRKGPWLDWKAIRTRTKKLISELEVVTPGASTKVGVLSGGNQQRLLAGRELLRSADLLVAESPTRGLDVKAAHNLAARLLALARVGTPDQPPPGIVLISTDLDEIISLADRIVVMVRGRVIPVDPDVRSPATLGELMLSAPPGEPKPASPTAELDDPPLNPPRASER